MRFVSETFENVVDIPDPIDPAFLLPADEPDLWAPRLEGLTIANGVPAVELAYVYLEHHVDGHVHLRTMLECCEPEEVHYIIRSNNMNHIGRGIARVILHPDRYELFDLPTVYDYEVRTRSVRANPKNERPFFEGFIEHWGVLKRD